MKNNKNIRIVTALALILTLLLSVSAVWAAEARDIESKSIAGISKTFEAVSSTKAYAEVMATSTGITPFIKSKITLQSAPLGSSSFSNDSSASPDTFSVSDKTSIVHTTYFPITSKKDYRIKIELTDKVNGMEITGVYYKTLDR